MALTSRQYVNNGNNNQCYDAYGVYSCNSAWNNWGRWVLFGGVVVLFIILALLLSCISARRRRRRNLQPIYGTGWAGRPPWGHGHAQYNPNYQGGYAQPQREPPYVQQPERQDRYAAPGADGAQGYGGYYGGGYGSPPDYYQSGRNTGQQEWEMQTPQRVYEPPMGPPKKK